MFIYYVTLSCFIFTHRRRHKFDCAKRLPIWICASFISRILVRCLPKSCLMKLEKKIIYIKSSASRKYNKWFVMVMHLCEYYILYNTVLPILLYGYDERMVIFLYFTIIYYSHLRPVDNPYYTWPTLIFMIVICDRFIHS